VRTRAHDDSVADDLRELPTELVGDEVIWDLRGDTQGLDVCLLQEHVPGRPEPSSNANAMNLSRQQTGLEEHVGNAKGVGTLVAAGAVQGLDGKRCHRSGKRRHRSEFLSGMIRWVLAILMRQILGQINHAIGDDFDRDEKVEAVVRSVWMGLF